MERIFSATWSKAGIIPVALYPDMPQTIFRESFFLDSPNRLDTLAPELSDLSTVLRVVNVPETAKGLFLHILAGQQKSERDRFSGSPEKKFPGRQRLAVSSLAARYGPSPKCKGRPAAALFPERQTSGLFHIVKIP